jgi:hypothetical protein
MRAYLIGASFGALAFAMASAQPMTTAPGTLTTPGLTLATLPKGNHYVCYPVKVETFKPVTATFRDQFGAWKMTLVKPTHLCTPAEKRVDNKDFPMVDPKLHMLCYKVTYDGKPPPKVKVTDQFGTQTMGLDLASTVCLPANKTVIK